MPLGGARAQNQPPWVKGTNPTDKGEDVPPWRRKAGESNKGGKPGTSVKQPPPGPTQQNSSGNGKPLTINLKSTVKKPEPEKAAPKTIPIQIVTTSKNDDDKMSASKPPSGINRKSPVVETKKAQNAGPPPPAPPAPPPPLPPQGLPPPPPPPPGTAQINRISHNPNAAAKIDSLRKTARKRPDWSSMMKEIETNRKLKHVECNDRSKPIIPRMKSLGKFVFDSEAKPQSKTDALHNKLLSEIQGGVRLKKVQCNDRSKPVLTGLRKLQKTMSKVDMGKRDSEPNIGAVPILDTKTVPLDTKDVPYEFLDIDLLREELQSTKQMLEDEAQTKVQLEKSNRDLKCQMITMEAEIETLKAQLGLIPEEQVSMVVKGLDKSSSKTCNIRKSRSGLYKSPSIAGIKKSRSGMRDMHRGEGAEDDMSEVKEMEEELHNMKLQVAAAKKAAQDWETKFQDANQKLLVAKGNLEDSEQKRLHVEKKLENLQKVKGEKGGPPVDQKGTQTEAEFVSVVPINVSTFTAQSDDKYDPYPRQDTEEYDSDVELDEAALTKKKQEREIKLWENKLRNMKEKQNSSKMERRNLKNAQKKLEEELKDAKVRHKELQKEVNKMASLLKEKDENSESEEDEDDSEEEEEDDDSEEEETTTEEEDEEEESSSEEDDEEADHDERLNVFAKRVKRRENILNALRKGNYLLRANIDQLQDTLEEEKIKYRDLEHELNVLADV